MVRKQNKQPITGEVVTGRLYGNIYNINEISYVRQSNNRI